MARFYCGLISLGLEVLQGGLISPPSELVFVRTGILTLSEFKLIYPNLKDEWTVTLRGKMIGKPYATLFYNLNDQGDVDPVNGFTALKGRFMSKEYPEGSQMRKILRREYRNLDQRNETEKEEGYVGPTNGGNFIHTPDSKEEAMNLLSYYKNLGDTESIIIYNSDTHM
jgi:hypothetical protein